jgi:hypothetical protein
MFFSQEKFRKLGKVFTNTLIMNFSSKTIWSCRAFVLIMLARLTLRKKEGKKSSVLLSRLNGIQYTNTLESIR